MPVHDVGVFMSGSVLFHHILGHSRAGRLASHSLLGTALACGVERQFVHPAVMLGASVVPVLPDPVEELEGVSVHVSPWRVRDDGRDIAYRKVLHAWRRRWVGHLLVFCPDPECERAQRTIVSGCSR